MVSHQQEQLQNQQDHHVMTEHVLSPQETNLTTPFAPTVKQVHQALVLPAVCMGGHL
jgi:hypothetical protein